MGISFRRQTRNKHSGGFKRESRKGYSIKILFFERQQVKSGKALESSVEGYHTHSFLNCQGRQHGVITIISSQTQIDA